MNSSSLRSMWNQLACPADNAEKISVMRFPSDCIPELFVGLDVEGRRCLLLTDNSSPNLPADTHENLSLSYLVDSSSGYIAIRLNNDFFFDLFDDFVSSIYNQISKKKSSPELSNEFIQIFLRWIEFFDNLDSKNMSFEALQGLMGELIFLGELLIEPQSINVNEILESWSGPYHTRTDFSLPEKHVEVKTISNSSRQVVVSSEYQLEKESGLGIELVVLFVDQDTVNGVSLREQVAILRDITNQQFGDFSIILRGLQKLGVSPSNIGDYDNTRFKFRKRCRYDAAGEGFPKLVRSTIHSSIKSVKYTLKLHDLSEFLIAEDD